MEEKSIAGRMIFLGMFVVACISRVFAHGGASSILPIVAGGFAGACIVGIIPVVMAKSNPRRAYTVAIVLCTVFFILPTVFHWY
jgi:uncharacterized membrane protein